MNLSWQVKEVNAFRTSNGPPKFFIELEADWLIISEEDHRKSPGYESEYRLTTFEQKPI